MVMAMVWCVDCSVVSSAPDDDDDDDGAVWSAREIQWLACAKSCVYVSMEKMGHHGRGQKKVAGLKTGQDSRGGHVTKLPQQRGSGDLAPDASVSMFVTLCVMSDLSGFWDALFCENIIV